MIGLFAAFYGGAHCLAWAKDYGSDVAFLADEIATRPYLAVSAVGFGLLLPLAATSTRRAVRRLGGRGWRRLHTLVYPAAISAFAHDTLAGRVRTPEWLVEGLALLVLLGWRLLARRRYAAALFGKKRAAPWGMGAALEWCSSPCQACGPAHPM